VYSTVQEAHCRTCGNKSTLIGSGGVCKTAKLQVEICYFIKERIIVANKLAAQRALSKIDHEDVILTFSKSSLVESILLNAHEKGVRFNVIVVDSRPLLEGKYKQ
jgi:translation initiation factor 2B subunit (eIF-2B alpha/beta/delta family)